MEHDYSFCSNQYRRKSHLLASNFVAGLGPVIYSSVRFSDITSAVTESQRFFIRHGGSPSERLGTIRGFTVHPFLDIQQLIAYQRPSVFQSIGIALKIVIKPLKHGPEGAFIVAYFRISSSIVYIRPHSTFDIAGSACTDC